MSCSPALLCEGRTRESYGGHDVYNCVLIVNNFIDVRYNGKINMKGIFLDRDDTIIKDKNYMYKVEDLDFFEDTHEALQIMQDKGYELFLVTNQSGIGREMFTEV
ncbi:HAD-IIIA family hydrolase, partial [Sulfurimonas sp. MAG313]